MLVKLVLCFLPPLGISKNSIHVPFQLTATTAIAVYRLLPLKNPLIISAFWKAYNQTLKKLLAISGWKNKIIV